MSQRSELGRKTSTRKWEPSGEGLKVRGVVLGYDLGEDRAKFATGVDIEGGEKGAVVVGAAQEVEQGAGQGKLEVEGGSVEEFAVGAIGEMTRRPSGSG
jgi:hypothetical protein